jgi:hypothetical protein
VARGCVEVNGLPLNTGDGATIKDVDRVHLKGLSNAEVLLFDLA